MLVSQGYRPHGRFNRAVEVIYPSSEYVYRFLDERKEPFEVELHCEVAPWYFCFPFDTDELLERAQPTSLAGATVLTLSPEDLLLILCMPFSSPSFRRDLSENLGFSFRRESA
ncbi:MAG: nucleotidyltransferase family protein [Acidobacteria bacterium]|nr:nucleotidyltransferase family protein [Acidobacteriota bacterium]